MRTIHVTVTSMATFKTTAEVDEDLLARPEDLANVVRSKASEVTGGKTKITVDVPGHWAGGPGIRAVPVRIEYAEKIVWEHAE